MRRKAALPALCRSVLNITRIFSGFSVFGFRFLLSVEISRQKGLFFLMYIFLFCLLCATDFALKCEYARERKKRGKASRKDIQAAAAAAAAAAAQHNGFSAGSASPTDSMRGMSAGSHRDSDLPPPPRPGSLRKKSSSAASTRTSIGDLHDLPQQQQQQRMHHHALVPQHHHRQPPSPPLPPPLPHHHQHQLPVPDSPSLHLGHDPISSGLPLHFDRMSPFHQQQSPNVPVSTQPFFSRFSWLTRRFQ